MTVPPPNPTIRSLAEWIAVGHIGGNPLSWIVEATFRGQAILDALNAADRERTSPSNWISVYDPSPAPRPNTPDAS